MLLPLIPIHLVGTLKTVFIYRLLRLFCVLFLPVQSAYPSPRDGLMSELYSTEWNGTDFLISGNGLSNQPFQTFNFYENNY